LLDPIFSFIFADFGLILWGTDQVEYPWQRNNLMNLLRGLSDSSYRLEMTIRWGRDGIIDQIVRELDDDGFFDPNPEFTIGKIVINRDEMQAVKQVTEALDVIIDNLDTYYSKNEEYTSHSEWPNVVEKVIEALAVLESKPNHSS
jgi:hypothetical protein